MSSYDSKKLVFLLENRLFIISIFFVLLVLVSLVFITVKRQEAIETESTVSALQTIVSSAEKILENAWFENVLRSTVNNISKTSIHDGILELIKVRPEREILIQHPVQQKLRKEFLEFHKDYKIKGLFVINRDYLTVASISNVHLARRNFIAEYCPKRLEKVFNGDVQFFVSMLLDKRLEDSLTDRPSIFILVPVFDDAKKVIAAFLLRVAIGDTVNEILKNSQLGRSGETYLFDAQGRMITDSRFKNHLLQTGLIENMQQVSGVDIRDPGHNLLTNKSKEGQSKSWPLTYGVRMSLKGDMSPYYDSYLDYRGVPVFGAWTWNEAWGVGIISEIDKDEAMRAYYLMRKAITIETIFGVLLFGLFVYIIYLTSKQTFIKLKENSAYLNTVIENSLNAMITINHCGIIMTYNKAAENLFGYKKQEVMGHNVSLLVPEPYKTMHDSYIQHYIQTGEKKIIGSSRNVEATTKEGKQIFIELGLSEAIYNGETFFIASIHDYTERVAYENQLQTNRDILMEAYRIGKMGYWHWFLEDNTIYCSPTMYSFYGMKAVDAAVPFDDVMKRTHPKDIERVQSTLKEVIEARSCVDDIYGRIIDIDGAVRFVVSSAKVIVDDQGNAVEMIGTMLDITKQRQEQQELELLKYALDQIDEAAYLIDENSIVHYANSGAVKQVGYSTDEWIGKSIMDISVNTVPEIWQSHWKELQEKKTIVWETQHLCKDGSILDVEIAASYIVYDDKFFNLAMVRDIRQRKEVEATIVEQQNELKRLNAQLNEKVNLSEEKLQQSEKLMILQARQAAMGEMISMIAHQWRQPLSAIAATALDMKIAITLDIDAFDEKVSRDQFLKDATQSLNDIEVFVKNLTHTIDDFRNFYKPNKEAIDTCLGAVIEKSLQMVRPAMESKGINFNLSIQSHKTLSLFENEIIQVLLNLFKNAQDNFLERSVENAQIWIALQDTVEGIRFEVCDNGGGITEDILPYIFEPYFSTKDEKNGTGLGLYMSKIIIEQHHNGSIAVKNRDDGVCFIITICDKTKKSNDIIK